MNDPWSAQEAGNLAPPGTTVHFRDGIYDAFSIAVSGTAAKPTRFVADDQQKPIIDGTATRAQYGMFIDHVSYLEVIGFTVQGGYDTGQSGGGILVQESSHVVVRGNTLRNNHTFGLRLSADSDVLVEKNDVYGNAIGIQVNHGTGPITVTNNDIHGNSQMAVNTQSPKGDDVGGEGLAIVNSTAQVLVTQNNVWGNRAVSYDYGWDGSAFSVFASTNWTIRDNVTWDNRNIFETGTDPTKTPCDNGQFVRNLNYAATTIDRSVGVILRCASNTLVANNTFYGMQFFVFDLSDSTGTYGGSIAGLRVANNIVFMSTGKVYNIESALPSTVVLDYNVLYDTDASQFATIQGDDYANFAAFAAATGLEQHGIAANPLFTDPAAHDFTLQPGSPAIDSAMTLPGITDGFEGAAPDRGRFEAPAPVPPTTSPMP